MYPDLRGRFLRELRVSVTDRCNLRCSYCMPAEIFGKNYAFLPKSEILSFEQILRLVRIMVKMGVQKVRITGGEPLLRRNLPGLINLLSGISDLQDIAITTNGILLPKYAEALAKTGLRRVNISLDALDKDLYQKISGGFGSPEKVIEAIEVALEKRWKPKVNMVVMRNQNLSQIIPMAELCKDLGVELRFIEYMDVGSSNQWNKQQVVTCNEILKVLSAKFSFQRVHNFKDNLVAQSFEYLDGGRFGVIASVSQPFCSGCGRVRISSQGNLYTCLFSDQGFPMKAMLRRSWDDQSLERAIRSIWSRRKDRYSEIRYLQKTEKKKIEMSYIGG